MLWFGQRSARTSRSGRPHIDPLRQDGNGDPPSSAPPSSAPPSSCFLHQCVDGICKKVPAHAGIPGKTNARRTLSPRGADNVHHARTMLFPKSKRKPDARRRTRRSQALPAPDKRQSHLLHSLALHIDIHSSSVNNLRWALVLIHLKKKNVLSLLSQLTSSLYVLNKHPYPAVFCPFTHIRHAREKRASISVSKQKQMAFRRSRAFLRQQPALPTAWPSSARAPSN